MMSSAADASPGRVALDDPTLRLLADPLRARIVELLATERLCTCHLVDELGAGQSNVSNHLRVLREAGVVSAEPAGRYTYYAVEPHVLDGLADRLRELAVAARAAASRRRPCS